MAIRELAVRPYRNVSWPLKTSDITITNHESNESTPNPSVQPNLDILICLGGGSKWDNNELRYCLRGIERHAIGLGKIKIVGQNPGWIKDIEHLPVNEPNNNKEHNIIYCIQQAIKSGLVRDDFMFFNDDHFLIDRFELLDYPYFQKGDLHEGVRHATSAGYQKAMRNTCVGLLNSKHEIKNFEVHVPIIYNAQQFMNLDVWWQRAAHAPNGMLPRSIYCNVNGIDGPTIPDCKIRKCVNVEDVMNLVSGKNVFSVADSAIPTGVGKYLQDMYPDKSKFEI